VRRAVVIIQARVGSTRLPGKVLRDIGGKPMLVRVVERARAIPGISEVVVATSTSAGDGAIVAMARTCGVAAFAGSETDVLDRFYRAACETGADVIGRVTADCPLLDPELSGRVVRRCLEGDVDFVTNCQPPTYPDGLDTEAVSFEALRRAWSEATLPSDREHVTPYLLKRPEAFRTARIAAACDLSALRWTVDDERDLAFVTEVYRRLNPGSGDVFGMEAVLALLAGEPALSEINRGTSRDEGYTLSLQKDGEVP